MHIEPKSKGDLVKLTDGTLTEADARKLFEGMRWPNGVVCRSPTAAAPRSTGSRSRRPSASPASARTRTSARASCSSARRAAASSASPRARSSRTRKIPLRTWLIVTYRMCSSKKSVSARQIEREFGLSHRGGVVHVPPHPLGHDGQEPRTRSRARIEADETYVGGKAARPPHPPPDSATMSERMKEAWDKKVPVFGMMERGGRVRARGDTEGQRRTQRRAGALARRRPQRTRG